MARPTSNPVIINDLIKFSTSDLRILNSLANDKSFSKELVWKSKNNSNKREIIASVLIQISDDSHFELSYQYMDINHSYIVEIEKLASNIRRGEVFFFKCPHCNRRCRKLFLFQGYFICRYSIHNSFYESQVCSKQSRETNKLINSIKNYNNAISDLGNENYRYTYNGITTKRHVNNLTKINSLRHFPL